MGQGLAWAGPAWLMASNTICKIKREKCRGLIFKDPIEENVVEKIQDLYVDDLAGGTNQPAEGGVKNISESIMQQSSTNLQEHVNLVNVTGGDIALEKCWFYLVTWIFKNGEAYAVGKECQNVSLQVKDPNSNEMIEITQMDVDVAHKTLGCYVNPLGIEDAAYKQIYNFAKEWKQANASANLRDYEILQSYKANLLPKIMYRLSTYSFTFHQCEQIMKLIRPTLLHAMHLQEHFPKVVMEAGDQYMGLNIKHIYDLMGSEKMKFLLMHVRRDDTTGKLMKISMRYTQLEVGSEVCFFNLDYERWGGLCTWTWMTHLWEYMSESTITIDTSFKLSLAKQRKNDKFIMDILASCQELSLRELQYINKVRQYFKVIGRF